MCNLGPSAQKYGGIEKSLYYLDTGHPQRQRLWKPPVPHRASEDAEPHRGPACSESLERHHGSVVLARSGRVSYSVGTKPAFSVSTSVSRTIVEEKTSGACRFTRMHRGLGGSKLPLTNSVPARLAPHRIPVMQHEQDADHSSRQRQADEQSSNSTVAVCCVGSCFCAFLGGASLDLSNLEHAVESRLDIGSWVRRISPTSVCIRPLSVRAGPPMQRHSVGSCSKETCSDRQADVENGPQLH